MECQFCHQGQEVEDLCGKLHKVVNDKCFCVAHQRCMQYSSNLTQFKFESFGGFYIDDVEKEIERGARLRCQICKKKGATAGCSYQKCGKTYHFPCASRNPGVFVKQHKKQPSQDINQTVSLFCTFCSISHQKLSMKMYNLVGADSDDAPSLDVTNQNMECEADDSSSQSMSLLQYSIPTSNERNTRGFDLVSPDVNATVASVASSAHSRSTDVLSIDENAVDNDLASASVTDENANGIIASISVERTSSETSLVVTSAVVSSLSSGNSTVAKDADVMPSAAFATHTLTVTSETEDSIPSSQTKISENAVNRSNSSCFNVAGLSQSGSNRRDRLCLRSSQKRRQERQINEEMALSQKRCLSTPDPSLPMPNSGLCEAVNSGIESMLDETIVIPSPVNSEELDFDSLSDPLADIPKTKSSECLETVSVPSLQKTSRQHISRSRGCSVKNCRQNLSQKLITSMLLPPKTVQNFDLETSPPDEAQERLSPEIKRLKISNEKFQSDRSINCAPVMPNILPSGRCSSDSGDAESGVVFRKELEWVEKALDINGQKTASKVLMMDNNETKSASRLEDGDSNSSSKYRDANSKNVCEFIMTDDSKEGSDDAAAADDDDVSGSSFEVMNSNLNELSSTFIIHQEKEMEVCALCIPISDEPVDRSTLCMLLKYAIFKLGLVEENVFLWQMTGYRKTEILSAVLQCSEYLRDQNDEKLVEKLLNKDHSDDVQNFQHDDSSDEKLVEPVLLKICSNFFIARQKYNASMGELYRVPDANIQAAFFFLNQLNDLTFSARSYLLKNRVYICNESTKFCIPFGLSDAQTKTISNLEYKNLIWCLENWFDYSTVLVYPSDGELLAKNVSSITNCIGSYFIQRMIPGGSTYFVFVYRTIPALMNYRLFVCKMLAFVKEELVTFNHDVCILFDVGREVGITDLSDVITPNLPEMSAGCSLEVQVYAGTNPKYSSISCLLMHLSLEDRKGFYHE